MAVAMSADEKRWQAENDARTLAESEVIKNDKARLTAAQEAAARMAEKEREEARAMQKVAGRKRSGTDNAKKRTSGTGSGPSKSTKHNVFQRI